MLKTFGDVLSKEDECYVFLADSEAVFYLAHILSLSTSNQLERFAGSSQYKFKIDLQMFDYTILQTKKFKGRAAHFGCSDNSIDDYSNTTILIEDKDLEILKKEILKSKNIAGELQDIIRNLS